MTILGEMRFHSKIYKDLYEMKITGNFRLQRSWKKKRKKRDNLH